MDQDCSSSARLEFDHVCVAYNHRRVLDDVSVEIPHGAQVAVVGPNGAGKSTLFKALTGLLPIESGQIFIHGRPLGSHEDCVAYIPQREEVDWNFPVTVQDVVMMGRYNRFGWFKNPRKLDFEITDRAMEMLGILDLKKQPIGQLSGGQQQRTFLARALAQEPHILLLDEPFTGVDLTTQETTLEMLAGLKKECVTVLVSTHDLNMASERFEQVLLLNHRVISFGRPEHAFSDKNLAAAFGHLVYQKDGLVLVDQCCPGDDHGSVS
ncbi:MAG: metal ABC transporter ATP-binding protein [Anaerolineaceae bacterium]